jgi:hypothetical protein
MPAARQLSGRALSPAVIPIGHDASRFMRPRPGLFGAAAKILFFGFVFCLAGGDTAIHAISAPAGHTPDTAIVSATPRFAAAAHLRKSGKNANRKADCSSY